MNNIIIRFDGQYDFLSNFAVADVVLAGITYPTVENAFQAAKTLSVEARTPFTQCSPGYAKKLGRQVSLRGDWELIKDEVMFELLSQKFAAGTVMAERLLSTGTAYLCEGNVWHDNHFGACTCDKCLYTEHQNVLGTLLMRIRKSLV